MTNHDSFCPFSRKLEFARSMAAARKELVTIGQSLRDNGWVINGGQWQQDINVYPNGEVIPLNSIGRRVLRTI